jgi:hypothetical protein
VFRGEIVRKMSSHLPSYLIHLPQGLALNINNK